MFNPFILLHVTETKNLLKMYFMFYNLIYLN